MFSRILKTLRQRDDGNAAVEFALVLPAMVFMALGAFDFGVAYSVQTSFESAVRAGFEYAFTNTDTAAIQKRVQANITDPATIVVNEVCECSTGTAVSCTGTCPTGSVYHYIKIDVSDDHTLLFDWPFLDPAITISYSGRVRVE